jgi:hypothetical protein
MKLFFRIDTDGGISAYPAKAEAQQAVATEGGQIFATERELAEVAKTAPMQTLVDTWNSLTGVTPVKKFKDRATAAKRIWEVVDTTLAPEMAAIFAPPSTKAQPKAKAAAAPKETPKEAAKENPAEEPKAAPREGSKKAQALAMLKRGTTREELQTAFGWLPHTTRGFLSILGKTNAIEIAKGEDGVRTYRLAS